MAEAGFLVRIVTPEDIFFESRAVSLMAPGFEGYLGVLENHAPLVTPLTQGRIFVRLAGGEEKHFETRGGFLEVSRNQVLILVEKVAETNPASAVGANSSAG